jgi:endonuclease/exonuclease/phosphatase family metal-dependent hydrolase
MFMLKVATWNIERGRNSGEIALTLSKHKVDIALLQECDVGMARSGNVHVPRSIAYVLETDYRMAIEFEEHGLGNDQDKAEFAGAVNRHGLHCNAIVGDGLPLTSHTAELTPGHEWIGSDQARDGGRKALICRVAGIWFATVHLENRTTPDKRAGEMERLCKALKKLGARGVVIGGDMNNKEGHEPLFEVAESYGYQWRDANRDKGRFAGRRLDWFFYRGVEVRDPRTIDAAGISDHDLMTLEVML